MSQLRLAFFVWLDPVYPVRTCVASRPIGQIDTKHSAPFMARPVMSEWFEQLQAPSAAVSASWTGACAATAWAISRHLVACHAPRGCQAFQSPEAGLCACACELPATDAGSEVKQLLVRGHRLSHPPAHLQGHALGVRTSQHSPDHGRRQCGNSSVGMRKNVSCFTGRPEHSIVGDTPHSQAEPFTMCRSMDRSKDKMDSIASDY